MDEPTRDTGDGAQPPRKTFRTASAAEAAAQPVGGRLARARAAAAQTRQEFTMVRGPLGVTKISLPHLDLFGVLWRLWAAKRVTGEADPGVGVAEIAETAGKAVGSVRTILATLIRNSIVRAKKTSVGWASNRTSYYPTELGSQVLGIAEMFGVGTSVQVGGTASAWRSRSSTAPASIFQHAAFLRGMVIKKGE